MIGLLDAHREKKMIELISYCVLGGCLLWTIGLVLYLCFESAQDEAKMEEVYRHHAKREWQKNSN